MTVKEAIHGRVVIPAWAALLAFGVVLGWNSASQYLGAQFTRDLVSVTVDARLTAAEVKLAEKADQSAVDSTAVRLTRVEDQLADVTTQLNFIEATVISIPRATQTLGRIDEKLDEFRNRRR